MSSSKQNKLLKKSKIIPEFYSNISENFYEAVKTFLILGVMVLFTWN